MHSETRKNIISTINSLREQQPIVEENVCLADILARSLSFLDFLDESDISNLRNETGFNSVACMLAGHAATLLQVALQDPNLLLGKEYWRAESNILTFNLSTKKFPKKLEDLIQPNQKPPKDFTLKHLYSLTKVKDRRKIQKFYETIMNTRQTLNPAT